MPGLIDKTRDRMVAVVLGVLTFAWYVIFSPSGLPPEMWGEAAIASSLRVPSSVFPGIARYLSMVLFSCLDFSTAVTAIVYIGHILTAVSVAFIYRILRFSLRCAGTPLEFAIPIRQRVARGICIIVTVMLAYSEAMLETSEALSPDSMLLFLSCLAMMLVFRYIECGGLRTAAVTIFLFGALIAESPFGFVLGIAVALLYHFWARGYTGFAPRPPSPYYRELFKWCVLVSFAAGFLSVFALNIGMFITLGGLDAHGIDFFLLVTRYFVRYGELFASTVTVVGGFLILLAVVIPFFSAFALLPQAVSDERFMPLRVGTAYFLITLLSAAQLGSVNLLWFRSWANGVCVRSEYLVDLCLLVSAVTLVLSLAVIAHEVFFRDYREIIQIEDDYRRAKRLDPSVIRRRRVTLAVVIPLGLVALSWPVGIYRDRSQMRSLLDEGVAEIVREAGNAKWLFTDGLLDDGIELAAVAKNGRRIYTLPLMCPIGRYAEYLRTRGGFEGEELRLVSISSVNAFSDWVLNRPDRMEELAFMLGFEMWRAAAKMEPSGSGFLARTTYAEGERERGIAAAKDLADRMLAFCASHPAHTREAVGPVLSWNFSAMIWRLSRLCLFRGETYEREDDSLNAETEKILAKKLDTENPYLSNMNRLRDSLLGQPRDHVATVEKLRQALMRADFAGAEVYARTVLVTDPGNASANFASGMYNYFAKNYILAENFLLKALDASPKDGVIWNSLAMCQLSMGNLSAAEKSAQEAVRLLPNSTAAKNTLLEIRRNIPAGNFD